MIFNRKIECSNKKMSNVISGKLYQKKFRSIEYCGKMIILQRNLCHMKFSLIENYVKQFNKEKCC